MCSLLPYSAGDVPSSCPIHKQTAILIRGQPNAKAGTLTIAAKVTRVAWCLAASFPASRTKR
jgi:hypothetical protein